MFIYFIKKIPLHMWFSNQFIHLVMFLVDKLFRNSLLVPKQFLTLSILIFFFSINHIILYCEILEKSLN